MYPWDDEMSGWKSPSGYRYRATQNMLARQDRSRVEALERQLNGLDG
jgi:hypothetical protein